MEESDWVQMGIQGEIESRWVFGEVQMTTIIRCVLTLAASEKWVVYKLAVNNAFLHGRFVYSRSLYMVSSKHQGNGMRSFLMNLKVLIIFNPKMINHYLSK